MSRSGRVLTALLLAVLAVLGGVTGAYAYWSANSAAGGNGAALSSIVNAGATPTTSGDAAALAVSWTASTLTSGQAVSGYQINRYDADTLTLQTILSACTGTVTALTCTENNVPAGSWRYTVIPLFATHWRGAESAPSSTVVVGDGVPPNNAITLSSITGGASLTGTTLYYRGTAAGSFRLTNAVTDTGTGPASSQTAALGGTSTGWTHTGSTVSTPTGGPYVSNAFGWAASTTSSPTEIVTGRDTFGNATPTTLTFANDSTVPTAAVSYADGYQPGRSVAVTFSSSDAGSGVATRQLQRAVAPLTSGTCGTFADFANLGAVNPTSVYTDSSVTSGACYMYRYVVTDSVGNRYIATSANVSKIDYAGALSSIGSLVSWWRFGEAAMTSSDSFVGTAGALLSSRASQDGSTWTIKNADTGTAVITGNNNVRIGAVGGVAYYTNEVPASADYLVEADIIVRSLVAGDFAGVVGRLDPAGTGTGTFYTARYNVTNTRWELYQRVNGSVLAAVGAFHTQTLVAGRTYRIGLAMSGSTISVLVDGTAVITAVDSAISAAGRAGIRLNNETTAATDSTGLNVDNFEVSPPAADSKGSNPGGYHKGVQLGAAGVSAGNTAATFDGSNDHMRTQTTTAIPVGATARTVEVWFKTSGLASGQARQALFQYGTNAAGQEFGVWLEANGTSIKAWGSGTGNDILQYWSDSFNDNTWHHFVKTYDGTAIRMYVDGIQGGTSNVSRNTVVNPYQFGVGGIVDPTNGGLSTASWFNGSLDEVAFYSTAFDQATVTGHYQLGVSPAADLTGPTGGSVDATGLGAVAPRYSTSTTLSIAFAPGTDPSGLATTGAQLSRSAGTLTGSTCSAFGGYVQVGGDDPATPTSDMVGDQACYRYRYVVADANGNPTTYTSPDIKVDTTPYAAHWKFDAGTGTSAIDSSGSGNTGTLGAGAGWTAGKVGANALSLNGTSTSNMTRANPVIDTSLSYSVSAWVKVNTTTGSQGVVGIEGTNINPFYLKTVDGAWEFVVRHSDAVTAGNTTVYGPAVVIGTWYHVIGVYNQSAGTIELFVNGLSQGSAAAPAGWKALGATTVGRGKWSGGPADFLNGAIDDVRLYDRVVTAAEITTISSANPGPTGGSVAATGLVGTASSYSTSTTLSLTVAKGSDPDGVAPTGARLRRSAGTLTSGVCSAFADFVQVGADDPASPVADTVADGACYRYEYVVTDTLGNESTYTSIDIKVDTTAPAAPALAFSALSNASVSGSTVYYRPGATSGGFTVTASATDTGSGIAAYTFAALGTGWASVAGAAGVRTYSWAAPNPAAPAGAVVTAANNAGLSSAGTALTMTADSTAPGAGSVTYADGASGTSVSVSFTAGTDAGSGVGTRLLQRAETTLSGTTCGTTYSEFATVTNGTNPVSPFVDTVPSGKCYMYRYVVSDNVGNETVATSANVVTVAAGSYSATIAATPGLVNYYRLGEAPAGLLATDTFTDGSGIALSSHTSPTGTTWTRRTGDTINAVISSTNTVRLEAAGGAAYYSSATTASADYVVAADLIAKTLVAGDYAGVVGRLDPAGLGGGTFYGARYNVTNTRWELTQTVDGSAVALIGTPSVQVLTTGTLYRVSLAMSGSTVQLLVNGELRVAGTHAGIPATGRAGIRVQSTTAPTNTKGMQVDNFEINPAALDSAGSDIGSYLNGVQQGVAGAPVGSADTAAEFDGAFDYVSIPRTIADDFSIEYWFKSTQGSGTTSAWWAGAGLVSAEVSGSSYDFGTSLLADGTVLGGVGNGSNDISVASAAGFNDGLWHHVVFTRTRATGVMTLYVDGVSAGSATSGTTALAVPTAINIGRHLAGVQYFAGTIDEVALYNVALPLATVSAHNAAGR